MNEFTFNMYVMIEAEDRDTAEDVLREYLDSCHDIIEFEILTPESVAI